MHRRRYLALTAATVAGVAGCTEDEGETEQGSANSGSTGNAESGSTDNAESGSTGNAESGSASGSGGSGVAEKVDLLEHEWYDEQFQSGVRGKAKNISDSELEYLKIKVVFLDADGVQIGDNFDNVTELAAGRTWQFETWFLGDDASAVDNYEITPSLSL